MTLRNGFLLTNFLDLVPDLIKRFEIHPEFGWVIYVSG